MHAARWNHLRNVSAPMKELLTLFPPLCRVIARRHLYIPEPGGVGRIVQYIDRGDHSTVLVQAENVLLRRGDPIEGAKECAPEWLMPVQYDGNKTSSWMEQLLSGDAMFSEDPILRGRIAGPMATDNPRLWVVRLDTAQPLEAHPDEIVVDGRQLYLAGNGHRRIPVTYAMSIKQGEA